MSGVGEGGLAEALQRIVALLDEHTEPDLDDYEHRAQQVYNIAAAALSALPVTPEASWPCDDYKPPLTCWTTPKPKTLICTGCREAFPDGPDIQRAYPYRAPEASEGAGEVGRG